MKELRLQTPFERWQNEPTQALPLDEAEEGVKARIYGKSEYVQVIARIPRAQPALQLTLADELHARHSVLPEAEAPEAA